MFRKVFQSIFKSGRRVLDDKVRISKSQVFKTGKGWKANQYTKGYASGARIHVQNVSFQTGWLRQFLKNGVPSKAMEFAQRANVQRHFQPLFTFSRRLGVSSSMYAFVAFNLNLADGSRQSSDVLHFHHICETIKERVISKDTLQEPSCLFKDNQVNITDLSFGEMISKGSDAAVHKAKKSNCEEIFCDRDMNDDTNLCLMENDTSLCLMENDKSYNLAVKVMYNFDYESNSDAIIRGMKKELLPLQRVNCQTEKSSWNPFFRSVPDLHAQSKRRLDPHPNIIKIEEVFVDDVQELTGCHEEYPASLPQSVNPNGFGRNKTLYIVMKRFPFTLCDYLHQQNEENLYLSGILFLQLLEGVLHLQSSNIAHRDIKSNNILIELKDSIPQLVITDFGCSFDGNDNLLARYENDIVDKGGNAALMAPEIACARPGPRTYLDFSKSDLWATGTLAYEIFGMENPFYTCFSNKAGTGLRNYSYHEDQLPDLPEYVPSYVNKLVKSVLRRDPTKRPDTLVVANALHILLWAPEEWHRSLDSGELDEKPCGVEVMRWLLLLTAEYILDRSQSVEHMLKGLFLSRLDLLQVMEAVDMLWEFSVTEL